MDNNELVDVKKFDFKMDKIERYLTYGMLALFIFSFNDKNGIWTSLLYLLTALIFVYYFVWYRKKPLYIVIENENIVIHPPLFYKRQEIKKQEIKKVKMLDKKMQILYGTQGKTIDIHSIILKEGDWKELTGILKQLEPKD